MSTIGVASEDVGTLRPPPPVPTPFRIHRPAHPPRAPPPSDGSRSRRPTPPTTSAMGPEVVSRFRPANLVGTAVGLRAGGWVDGAEGGEDCGRLKPWRRRLLASMALSCPSAVRLAVAAVLLVAVVVALFTLPVEKAIVDAYKEDPGNPRYSFRHLLFSVTDPAQRVKPVAASDIMWVKAMGKLECMDSADREMLWPKLVQGFKDLSHRLKDGSVSIPKFDPHKEKPAFVHRVLSVLEMEVEEIKKGSYDHFM